MSALGFSIAVRSILGPSEFAEFQGLAYIYGFLQPETRFKCKVSVCLLYCLKYFNALQSKLRERASLQKFVFFFFLSVEASRKGNFEVLEFGHLGKS